MTTYLAKRLLLALVTLLAILATSYALLRLAPGDPTRSSMFGSDTAADSVSQRSGFAANLSMRKELHLDEPMVYGFVHWLKTVVTRGDFGRSVSVDPGKPVIDLIMERLPLTINLNLWAVALTYALAIPLGVFGARHENEWSDKLCATLLFGLYSLPVMWVGLLSQSLLCEGGVWEIFPLKGASPQDPDSIGIWQLQLLLIRYRILPILCLAYGGFAALSRFTRSSMLDVINCDFMRTATAKGLCEFDVTWRHGFRNALITLITLTGGLLPSLITGSVIVEYIFNIPGMGTLALLSLSSRDYPLQMALFFATGALTLIGILISDLLYAVADPRINLAK